MLKLVFSIAFILLDVFQVRAQKNNHSGFSYQSHFSVQEYDTVFGNVISDPFRYLEDADNPKTKEFIRSQKEFLELQKKKMGYTSLLTKQLKVKNMSSSRALVRQGKYYFSFEADFISAPVLYYRTRVNEIDKLAVSPKDFNLSKDDVASIQGFKLSGNDQYLAVSLSHSGSDWREIRVVELHTGKILEDQLSWVRFSNIYWKGNGFFYCRYDIPEQGKTYGKLKNQKLYYHKLGTDQKNDLLIYEIPEVSESFFEFEVSHNEQSLFIYSVKGELDANYKILLYQDLNQPNHQLSQLLKWPYTTNIFYSILQSDGRKACLLSNVEGFNRSVLELDLDVPGKLRSIVPPVKDKIAYATVVSNKILTLYTDNYNYAFAIYNLQGKLLTAWGLPQGAAVHGIYAQPSDKEIIYYFESFYYPHSFYTLNIETYERKPLSKTTVLYNADYLKTEYIEYPSKDGTLIPMFITYDKRIKLNGDNPCLLIGYGGFGSSMLPHFEPLYSVLYDFRGIVAVPCLRGGGEKEGWHDDGKNLKKQNTIDDLIAAGEYLISKGYTNSSKLSAYGASNGAMVATAAMIKSPKLFASVIGEVGVYDMLRYQYFTGGYLWKDEYGAIDDSVQFKNLLSYSPLHTLKNGIDYPSTLLITAKNDDRVPPFHSYKFVASLQKNRSKNLYLLYTQKDAGHSGSELIDSEISKDALKLSFLFYTWGLQGKLYDKYPKYKFVE